MTLKTVGMFRAKDGQTNYDVNQGTWYHNSVHRIRCVLRLVLYGNTDLAGVLNGEAKKDLARQQSVDGIPLR